MDNKLVSVITCSYNYEKYIKETIESVLAQTYTNWEMIIVDDGSKDNSLDVISEYVKKDERIKLYTHENGENKGLIATLKLGIEKAQGEYIVFLESDDYIRNDYIDRKISVFNKFNNVGLVYNDIELFGCKNQYFKLRKKVIGNVIRYWNKNDYPHNVSDEFYLRNLIPTFSVVMVRTVLIKRSNIDSVRPAWVDWWIWAQISNWAEFYCLPDKLTYWRVHKNSYDTSDNKYAQTYVFYENLYSVLQPIKTINNKIRFIIKVIGRYIKYKVIHK